MAEKDDETAKIDAAFAEHQRREREELDADLRRQAEADRRVIEALSRKQD